MTNLFNQHLFESDHIRILLFPSIHVFTPDNPRIDIGDVFLVGVFGSDGKGISDAFVDVNFFVTHDEITGPEIEDYDLYISSLMQVALNCYAFEPEWNDAAKTVREFMQVRRMTQ